MADSKTLAVSAPMPNHGVPASAIDQLAARTGMSKDVLLACLNIPRTAKASTLLSKDESKRVRGMEALIDMLQTMVEESGDPTGFDAARALSGWLRTPLPALG